MSSDGAYGAEGGAGYQMGVLPLARQCVVWSVGGYHLRSRYACLAARRELEGLVRRLNPRIIQLWRGCNRRSHHVPSPINSRLHCARRRSLRRTPSRRRFCSNVPGKFMARPARGRRMCDGVCEFAEFILEHSISKYHSPAHARLQSARPRPRTGRSSSYRIRSYVYTHSVSALTYFWRGSDSFDAQEGRASFGSAQVGVETTRRSLSTPLLGAVLMGFSTVPNRPALCGI